MSFSLLPVFCLFFAAYCLLFLFAAYCLLFTVHRSLLPAYFFTAYSLLPTAYCLLFYCLLSFPFPLYILSRISRFLLPTACFFLLAVFPFHALHRFPLLHISLPTAFATAFNSLIRILNFFGFNDCSPSDSAS